MSVVILKKGEKKTVRQQKLSAMQSQRKLLDAYKYTGKLQLSEDPLKFQKRIRNEWE